MPNKTYIIHVGALWARLTTLQYMQYNTLLKIVFPINIELIQTVLQKVDFWLQSVSWQIALLLCSWSYDYCQKVSAVKATILLCFSRLFFSGLQHGKGAEVYGAAQPKAGSSLPQPFFDTMIDPDTGQGGRNVTTAEGGKSLLFCTIRHLGKNNTVRLKTLLMMTS